MGQYYYAVILDANGWIRVWMAPGFGAKLMEHSYLGSIGVGTFEWELTPEGRHHMSRVAWCGDYADAEPGLGKNLHLICNERKDLMIAPTAATLGEHPFLVNHTKRQFVDKSKIQKGLGGFQIHPLPLRSGTAWRHAQGNAGSRTTPPSHRQPRVSSHRSCRDLHGPECCSHAGSGASHRA